LGLLPWCALLLYLSRRETLSRRLVASVIGGNAAWVAASLLLVIDRPFELNALGIAFVLVQAAVVAVIAELQYVGLRKSGAAAA